jgi:hypothetical protein
MAPAQLRLLDTIPSPRFMFVYSLLDHPITKRRFPSLRLRPGSGPFVSAMMSWLEGCRRKGLVTSEILTQLSRELPGRSFEYVLLRLLAGGMLERFATYLPTETTGLTTEAVSRPTGSAGGDGRIHWLRLELARYATELAGNRAATFREIVARERAALAAYAFYEQVSHGRVSVDWTTVRQELRLLFEGKYGLYFTAVQRLKHASGDPPRLRRTTSAPGASPGRSDRGARDAGGARRVR